MVSLTGIALLCILGVLVVNKWIEYRKAVARINYQPGPRFVFGPYSLIGVFLSHIPYISTGRGYFWRSKRSDFEKVGMEIYGFATLFPVVSRYCVSDPTAIKQMTAPRGDFKKRYQDYRILTTFGSNLVAANGPEWKRQRRICAPAFSDKNNKLVWSTAIGFVNDMTDTWTKKEPVHIHDICKDVTLPIGLCVIAKAGYGRDVKWKDDDQAPPGHELTFKQALLTVSDKIYLPLLMPNWAWGLRKSWMRVKKANDELRLYIHEMISARRELQDQSKRLLIEEKHDIFNYIVHAHDEKDMLSEDELMGNAFVFLIAGHETTAHSLAIALTLMAIYPEEQAKLVQEIQQVQPQGRDFTYDDMPKLPYALAVLYETLRLYPMAPLIPKVAAADTTLNTKMHGTHTSTSVTVRESSSVSIMATALHYNPQYWDSPLEFVPERFMSANWNRDAFVPFSAGPRSCIGRRQVVFAETTVVATLVGILSKYTVSVDEERFKSIPGESITDMRERLMNISFKMTLTPEKVALVFTPRTEVP